MNAKISDFCTLIRKVKLQPGDSQEVFPQSNTILVGYAGNRLGKVNVLGSDAGVYTSNRDIAVIVNDPDINVQFLYYQLLSQIPRLKRRSYSGERISFRLLQNLQVNIPPSFRQKQAIAKLENELNRLEKKRYLCSQLLEYSKTSWQQVLEQTINESSCEQRMIGDEKWNTISLAEIGIIQLGVRVSTVIPGYFGGEYPLFRAADFNQGIYLKNTSKKLTQKGYSLSKKVDAKAVLVINKGKQLGGVAINKIPGALSSELFSVLPYPAVAIPEFVYFRFLSSSFQKKISELAVGNENQRYLSKSQFERLKFKLPPYSLQKKIINSLHYHHSVFTRTVARLQNEIQVIEKKKIQVIQRYISI